MGEAYAFLEANLASALSDHIIETDVNPAVLDSFSNILVSLGPFEVASDMFQL